MTEVPKIVYDRLRAARPERTLPERTAPEPAHPDADLLTAFAEQALSTAERDGVLGHLALCEDCREAIALALPAEDVGAAPTAEKTEAVHATSSRAGAPAPHRLIFAWPHLRWAALAAAVVVVAAVLLVRPGKLNQEKLPSGNTQIANNLPPTPGPQGASTPLPSPRAATSTGQTAEAARADEARPKSELRLSKKLKAGQVATPSFPAESGMLLAENEITDHKMESKEKDKEADRVSAAPTTRAWALDSNAPAIPRTNETVEVTAASAAVQTESSSLNVQMARNSAPPIAKAKPAPQTETSLQQNVPSNVVEMPLNGRNVASMAKLAAPSGAARTRAFTWTIAAGVLQRSEDSGQSWQNALRADHPLLCYASLAADIWTGGQAGTLFHSADSGATWFRVQPSISGQQLSSDITHIDMRSGSDVRGPAEIVVSTSNNEIWSSADGGKTWEKK
jgi:hypothetical protein